MNKIKDLNFIFYIIHAIFGFILFIFALALFSYHIAFLGVLSLIISNQYLILYKLSDK